MARSLGDIPPLNSYATALVLLPPAHIQSQINPIRSTNDKSFPRWTAHLTLLFPFVEPAQLPRATSIIRDALLKDKLASFAIQLDKVARFEQRNYDTIYLGPSKSTDVERMWNILSSAMGYSGRPFVPHLTLGQAFHRDQTSAYLQNKGRLLVEAPIQWEIHSVVILRRSSPENGLMKLYEEISFSPDFSHSSTASIAALHPTAYIWSSERWISAPDILPSVKDELTLATYNVLSDIDHPTVDRLPRLVATLLSLNPIPDIICLQEMTDEFLRCLLTDSSIRARWQWCTHDPLSVLPGKHNITFLARESFGFSWEYVPLRTKHKPAAILRFQFANVTPHGRRDVSLVIGGMHLTAGLAPSHQRIKAQELESLLLFLRQRYPLSLWVLIGDTNVPTTQKVPLSISNAFDDAWLVAHGTEEGGATFDPDSNALASETVKNDRTPQRYDRIWFSRDKGIHVRAIELFGHGVEVASDHYGVMATLTFSGSMDAGPHVPLTTFLPSHWGNVALTHPDEDLKGLVQYEGGFPTDAQKAERAQVVAALQVLFSLQTRSATDIKDPQNSPNPAIPQPQPSIRFEFLPVGSVGFGIDTMDSDMDVLTVGSIPPHTFWTLARARLRKMDNRSRPVNELGIFEKTTPNIVLKRFVKDASVQMMELLVGDVRVDLQYCCAPKLLECWDQVNQLPPTDPVFLLPASSMRALNAYRDMDLILRVLPQSSHATFRLAHRALKLFCISHGIYSSRLGFLGGFHITLLLSRTVLLSPPDTSATQLIMNFFATYSSWDWSKEAVVSPQLSIDTMYTRSDREPMVILSVNKPVRNVVHNANKHTTNAIISVFKEAHRQQRSGIAWSDIYGSGGVCGEVFKNDFLRSHDSFIKIDLSLWGSNVVQARAWIGFVESRLLQLLVLLQASSPDLNARLWPARFVESDSSGVLATGISTFYLIGLDTSTEPSSEKKVQAVLHTFEDKLPRDERFYNSAYMFVCATHIPSTQLPDAITLPPAWSDGGIDPDDGGSDDEEYLWSSDEQEPKNDSSPVSPKQKKKRQPPKGSNAMQASATRLRTSLDVYNRLIWDSALDSSDYVIGYEDRFVGTKEMPLGSWKREVEDEEFVPFHRVTYFRRKSDGVMVWDKRKKIDLVFGSGVREAT